LLSPSSRRAWIEIVRAGSLTLYVSVALLAEGVDRNMIFTLLLICQFRSPSSRRAWIEIFIRSSVSSSNDSRPPRGGRG